MTTYAYTVTMNDSEIIMLRAALELMIKHCEQKMEAGPKAHYWAQSVLDKLYNSTIQNHFN